MTPSQFYFPYFFNLDKFNKNLSPFGLSSHLTYDEKTKMPNDLVVNKKSFFKSTPTLLIIPFGATLMVNKDKLFYWSTDYDTLSIKQIQLSDVANVIKMKTQEIDLRQFSLGHNKFDTDLEIADFVSYIRKEDLKYEQDYYEKFVLVFINNDDINLIPFDWFNKSGGDYGYVWPAIAKFDKVKSKLYGQGMRMSDFAIDLEKACL